MLLIGAEIWMNKKTNITFPWLWKNVLAFKWRARFPKWEEPFLMQGRYRLQWSGYKGLFQYCTNKSCMGKECEDRRERCYQLFSLKSSSNLLAVTGKRATWRVLSSQVCLQWFSYRSCHDCCVFPACLPGTLYLSFFIVCTLVIHMFGFFQQGVLTSFITSIWLFYFVFFSSVRDTTLELQSFTWPAGYLFFTFWVSAETMIEF